MFDRKFFGTIQINDTDDYGVIHLKFAVDLLKSILMKEDNELIKAKARNIIQICCEPMFDGLIIEFDWTQAEADYAEQVLVQCMDCATENLLQLAKRRVRHAQKHERNTGLKIEDMKAAAIMALVMTARAKVSEEIRYTFLEEHGDMYFKR